MSSLPGLLGFGLLAAGAGVSFVIQRAVNADLRAVVGSAAWAGFISYLGGTLCMLVLALVTREPLPSVLLPGRADWRAWSGGFFGAIYIGISILLVARLGTIQKLDPTFTVRRFRDRSPAFAEPKGDFFSDALARAGLPLLA